MVGSLGRFGHVSSSSTLSNTTRKNTSQKVLKKEQEKKDSPFNGANLKNVQSSQIDALMKEKESIEKAKQEFSKNSETMDQKEYQDKINEYNKQIADIEKQINQTKLEEQKEKSTKNVYDDNNSKYEKNNSNSPLSLLSDNNDKADELMNNLVMKSDFLSKSNSLNGIKKSISSTKREFDSYIKLDESRRIGKSTKYNYSTSSKLSNQLSKVDNELDKLGKEVKTKNTAKSEDKNSADDKKENSKASTLDNSDKIFKSDLANKIRYYSNTQNYNNNESSLDYIA